MCSAIEPQPHQSQADKRYARGLGNLHIRHNMHAKYHLVVVIVDIERSRIIEMKNPIIDAENFDGTAAEPEAIVGVQKYNPVAGR